MSESNSNSIQQRPREAQPTGAKQTAEGYYNWLYNRYKNIYDEKTAREMAQWGREKWERSQKGGQ